MSAYFSFQASPSLAKDLETVLAHLDHHDTAPQAELYVKMSIEMTDAILQVLLLDLVKATGSKSGVLEQLAGLLRGTMHVLLRQLLAKRDNDELAKAAVYVHARRRYLGSTLHVAIPLSDSLRTRFEAVFMEIDAGRGEANREELRVAMSDFVDQAVSGFYDEFVQAMPMGFLMSKAAQVARATIFKGAHAAMNKMIPSLSQAELKGLADYFDGFLYSDPVLSAEPVA